VSTDSLRVDVGHPGPPSSTSLGNQAITMLASRVVAYGVLLGSSVAVARALDVHAFGEYAAATGILSLVVVLGLFGFDQLYLAGDISAAQLERRSRGVAALTAGVVLAAAVAWPSVDSHVRILVGLLGVAAVCELLWSPYLLVPQRNLDIRRRARRELVLRLLAGGAITAAAFSHSLITVGLVAASVAALTAAVVVPSFTRARAAGAPDDRRLTAGLWFAVSGAMYTVYFQADLAILAVLSPSAEVARYKVAYALVTASVLIPIALNNEVMRPRLYRQRTDVVRRATIRWFGVAAIVLGLATGALVFLAGPAVVSAVFGAKYGAGTVVRILAFALPLHFVVSWAGNVLVADGRTRAVVIAQTFLAVGNVAANVVVIPRHGAAGAAVVTVATEATALLLLLGLMQLTMPLAKAPQERRSPQPEPS
jgi:O-antigen/teichoic acid export membrane protein